MDIKSIWAKKVNGNYHPLTHHILDVYHTSNALIGKNINIFSKLASFSKENQKIWSAVIGLHDIGKATPGFQKRIISSLRHETLSIYILFHYLKEKFNIPGTELWTSPYFQAIKFIILHHSKFESINTQSTLRDKYCPANPIGDSSCKNVQFEVIDGYFKAINLEVTEIKRISFKNISDSAFFAGLMTLADWIGSDEKIFKAENYQYSIHDYIAISKKRAEEAIQSTGFDIIPNIQTDSWPLLFPQIQSPRNLQIESINCTLAVDSNLIIIEAPTGEGKTEAALNLCARLSKNKNSGIYVAMPTQATSNGLLDRFSVFLSHADMTENTNLKLIHGGTILKNLKDKIEQTNILSDDEEIKTDAFTWFNKGKRAFLAPYGIGTVDQALYSILIVKHFFLRLYSLAGKTVIFDEVHAYDAYMNQLLLHLIKWLKALKANVIVLSATLPLDTKNMLINTWDETVRCEMESTYPVLNVISSGKVNSYPFEARFAISGNNNFTINFCGFDDDNIVQLAETHYQSGARVLVIVNTVKRAQQIYRKLTNENKVLFHSRFTSKDRERIEQDVLKKYGKGATAQPSILVSTQIVEQSLDIDFDVIISDLAPIDLLIQRAGRLHRHDRVRPQAFENPQFTIATHEADEKDLPKIIDGKIYAPIILYRTYFSLKQNSKYWNFHRDFREPVESVYYPVEESSEQLLNTDLSAEAKQLICKSISKFHQETLNSENEATKVLISPPDEFDNILSYSKIVHQEEEENGRGIIAKTRLGTDSEKLILLFEYNNKYYFDCSGNDELDTGNLSISTETTYKLMSNLISLYFYQAMKYADKQPDWWESIKKNNKMLKHYRLLIISDNDSIQYDNTYGLTHEE